MRRPLCIVAVLVVAATIFYTCIYHTYKAPSVEERAIITLSGNVIQKEQSEKQSVIRVKTRDNIYGIHGVICYLSNPSNPAIGAAVEVTGQAAHINQASNPGEFDAATYYEVRGYNLFLYQTEVTLIKTTSNPFPEYFFQIKQWCLETIRESFPQEYGSVQTLLLADTSSFDSNRKELYKRSGISHYFVVSGLHISIICGAIYKSLRRHGVSLYLSAAIGLVWILLYGFLLGFTISVLRACIMYLLRILADLLKRSYDMVTALSLSAILVLTREPLWVMDASFVLSYGSVLALAAYSAIYPEGRGKQSKSTLDKLRESFRLSIFLFLALLPVTLHFFYLSSYGAMLLNTVVGYFMTPFLMIAIGGFAGGMLKAHGISYSADSICSIILSVIDWICNGMNQLGLLQLGKMHPMAIFLYYCVVIILFRYKSLPKLLRVVLLLSALTIPRLSFFHGIEVIVLDVGQGECICIRNYADSAIIVDCGSTSKELEPYIVLPYLKAEGIRRISDLYISHSDSDHCNGVVPLIEDAAKNGIQIERIIISSYDEQHLNSELVTIINKARDKDIEISYLKANQQIEYGQVMMRRLWSGDESKMIDENSASMVLLLRYREFEMLLTGDINKQAEKSLRSSDLSHADILKVPHHGSDTSCSEELLKQCNPQVAIISCGKNNPYGHPSDAVRNRLMENNTRVYITMDMGAIRICTDGKNMIQLIQYKNLDNSLGGLLEKDSK